LFIGKKDEVKAAGPKIFTKRYNLNQPQIAIRFFLNNPTEPIKINGTDNTSVCLSNIIEGGNSIFNLYLND
jgi:hypothetical protein